MVIRPFIPQPFGFYVTTPIPCLIRASRSQLTRQVKGLEVRYLLEDFDALIDTAARSILSVHSILKQQPARSVVCVTTSCEKSNRVDPSRILFIAHATYCTRYDNCCCVRTVLRSPLLQLVIVSDPLRVRPPESQVLLKPIALYVRKSHKSTSNQLAELLRRYTIIK